MLMGNQQYVDGLLKYFNVVYCTSGILWGFDHSIFEGFTTEVIIDMICKNKLVLLKTNFVSYFLNLVLVLVLCQMYFLVVIIISQPSHVFLAD